ncbi:N-acetyl-gamma-glutamyl-phosphate reductase [Lentilactobacillus farraginis]|uniref:N-acetyl-gamma-glutamyl-phosphate reductase n=1 Tax=Lentilactobacillus farraginis DSM 18382 = JCM 14108 TaxID=1423743 RepID=X0PLW5_9LACO|nr:N-acetyl-gamma-glutamyl-phosphate reductase [Lentilactobacillus farraginis]KRM03787.1 N-acetyl-gamma-glutamyl-phosphate reductase [Lentilactobacillus farraginis DSM 18382 = JCM 14108]GAF37796.1 N-acetyl-gamma-glutamyl-phosphate reductase [Lentilactobacillus farraginis DSM 18382 = JCM 14108]
MQAALVGVTGYAGMVLYQLLKGHPNIKKINIYDHKLTAPADLASVAPVFKYENVQVQPYEPSQIMAANDVVFFATSAGVTAKASQPFLDNHFPVIDLSGDLRLNTRDQYEKWYHKPAAPEKSLQQAHYGLAEFESVKGQTYVANPGCYATATLLGLAPLVQKQLIDVNSIIVDAKSGTSGAGKKLSASTHFTEANDNLQIYKPNQHQHIPEIVQELQKWDQHVSTIQFMTTLIPVTRGIMSTIYARVNAGVNQAQLEQAYHHSYDQQPFVHFTDTELPTIKQVVGTNNCDIGLAYNPETKIVMIDSVIDNMLKGAAGQAVQNLNQMFDYPETAGLALQPALI